MGILNITPDSFSGDGLLRTGHAVGAALDAGRQMVAAGADLLDVGGESTRPGGTVLSIDEERERVVPVLRGLRAAFPDVPLSIDTIKPEVAEAALDAGADLLNDVWGVRDDPAMLRVAAARGVPIVLMHNRTEPVYRDVAAEVVDDLRRAVDRARAAGLRDDQIIVDPGIGFGKTADQNLELLSRLEALRSLGQPIMLGTSRKSTLGRLLDLPPDRARGGDARDDGAGDRGRRRHRPCARRRGERARGADRRCHPPRVAARRVEGRCAAGAHRRAAPRRRRRRMTDRIVLHDMRFQGHHGQTVEEQERVQPFEVDVELPRDLRPAGVSDDLTTTIDYSTVYDLCKSIVEARTYHLLEAIAEAIAAEVLATFDADEVTVRVRKPAVRLSGPIGYAGVEIHRRRSAR